MANNTVTIGRVSTIPREMQNIYVMLRKTTDILEEIVREQNSIKAIELITEKFPDGKMALNTYLRFSNQGGNFTIKNTNTGRAVKKANVVNDLEHWLANIGSNTNLGLDGLIDQMNTSGFIAGGIAVEAIVAEDLSDIVDLIIVNPKTFKEWKYEESKGRYALYQQRSDFKKIDLFDGNFFWSPHQPKIGSPEGTLKFEPAIQTVTQYYQLLSDAMMVLNRIGWPRYDASIDENAVMESATAEEKSNPDKRDERFEAIFNQTANNLRRIGKNNDLVHWSSTKIEQLGGGTNGSGIDVRAWFEILEPLICNAFQLPPVMLGRQKGGSYALGTAEFKTFVDTIDSMRLATKRTVEQIVNFRYRVQGLPYKVTYTPNIIDWQEEIEKWKVALLKMEHARRAEEYKWVSHDTAALMGIDTEKAEMTEDNFKTYVKSTQSATTEEKEPIEPNKDNENKKDK